MQTFAKVVMLTVFILLISCSAHADQTTSEGGDAQWTYHTETGTIVSSWPLTQNQRYERGIIGEGPRPAESDTYHRHTSRSLPRTSVTITEDRRIRIEKKVGNQTIVTYK